MNLRNRLKILLSASALLCGFAGTAQQVKYNDSFTLYVITPKETTDKVWLKGRYKDSQPDGRWEFYEFDGYLYLYEVHNYRRGLLNDTFYRYDSKGDVVVKGAYSNNLKSGLWLEGGYTRNYINDTMQGWQKTEWQHTYMKNGRANGPHYEFNLHRDTSVWGQYVNDSREGRWIVWKDGRDGILHTKTTNLKTRPITWTTTPLSRKKPRFIRG